MGWEAGWEAEGEEDRGGRGLCNLTLVGARRRVKTREGREGLCNLTLVGARRRVKAIEGKEGCVTSLWCSLSFVAVLCILNPFRASLFTRRFRFECFLMKELRHPNICSFVGICW